jgi:hypothetical protein
MLAAMGGMAGAAAAGRTVAAAEPAPTALDRLATLADIEKAYRRLLPLWQKEREKFRLSSSTDDYWQGPNGKAIIALGPAIIPFLVRELRKGDYLFNVPLRQMTHVALPTDDPGISERHHTGKMSGQEFVHLISEQDQAKLWVKWWDSAQDGKQR